MVAWLAAAAPYIAQAAPAVLGMLGSSMGGNDKYEGPTAESFLQQIPGIGHKYFDPYVEKGAKSQDIATERYMKMAQDPSSFVNQLMSSYKPSTGYQFREQRGLDAMRNSAAAGGYTGTREDQLGQAELVNGLLGQDMQQWLANLMGAQGRGLEGLNMNSQMGYGASGQLADLLSNTLGSQAMVAAQREGLFNKGQQKQSDLFGSLGNMLGVGLGGLLGNMGGGSGSRAGATRVGNGSTGMRSLIPGMGGGMPGMASSIFGGFR